MNTRTEQPRTETHIPTDIYRRGSSDEYETSKATLAEAQKISHKDPELRESSFYVKPLGIKDIYLDRSSLAETLATVEREVPRRRSEDKKKVRTAARIILCNLVHCIYTRDLLAVSRSNGDYSAGGYLHSIFLTREATCEVLDALVRMGWVTAFEHKHARGLASRYFPTRELEERIFEWLYLVEGEFKPPYIFRRTDLPAHEKRQGKKAEKRMEPLGGVDGSVDFQRLEIINNHLRNQSYALKGPEVLKFIEVPISGGRVYLDLQCLPDRRAKVRLNTLINGERVAEIDLKANHLRLAAALERQELPDDPYQDICNKLGIDRQTVKTVVNKCLSSKGDAGKHQTMYAAEYLSEKGEQPVPRSDFEAVEMALRKTYPFIRLFEGIGVNLQSLEGAIMMRSQVELIKQGITSLPIHDALMVPRQHIEAAKSVLREQWRDELGVSWLPPVEVDQV